MTSKWIISITLFILIIATLKATDIVKTDYVSQNIGMRDVTYTFLFTSECMNCHKGDSDTIHHESNDAINDNCDKCHNNNNEEKFAKYPPSSCKGCHGKSTHHSTKNAIEFKCATCHNNSLITNFNREKKEIKNPDFVVMKKSCRNCHREAYLGNSYIINSTSETHHYATTTEKDEVNWSTCESCHYVNDQGDFGCTRCHQSSVIHNIKPHIEKDEVCLSCHE